MKNPLSLLLKPIGLFNAAILKIPHELNQLSAFEGLEILQTGGKLAMKSGHFPQNKTIRYVSAGVIAALMGMMVATTNRWGEKLGLHQQDASEKPSESTPFARWTAHKLGVQPSQVQGVVGMALTGGFALLNVASVIASNTAAGDSVAMPVAVISALVLAPLLALNSAVGEVWSKSEATPKWALNEERWSTQRPPREDRGHVVDFASAVPATGNVG